MTKPDIEELKRHVGVLSLYSNRVQLKREGQEFIGLCPFHSEKTPSFRVSSHQGVLVFKCFGCGKSGDIIKLIQELDGLNFKDAVQKIKDQLGYSFSDTKKADATFSSLSEPKPAITYGLEDYKKYEDILAVSQEGQNWLKSRGINYETAKRLHVGFRETIKGSALKNWICFPSIVGNRILSIKYRNTGEKTFFKQPGMCKGEQTPLFNAETVEPLEPIYLVEGEIDCLTMEQAGFHSASLQSSSTSLTAANKEKLLEADYIILAGDNTPDGNACMDKIWAELQERVYKFVWPEGMKDANQTFLEFCKGDIPAFQKLVEELTAKAKANLMPGVSNLRETFKSAQRVNTQDSPFRWRWPWPGMDSMVTIMPGSVVYISATNTGMGKELDVNTNIVTPNGLVKIKDIKTGDYVIGSNGKPTKVIGVFPQGVKKSYKISFTNGTSVVCGEEHLWAVRSNWMAHKNKPFRILSLKQIIDMDSKGFKIKSKTGGFRHHIPTVKPVFFNGKYGLPLTGYVLGALLGDGGFTCNSVSFTNTDNEILNRISNELPSSVKLKKSKGSNFQYNIVKEWPTYENPVKTILHDLKLLGLYSHEKFIPDIYKFSDIDTRINLLQGLLDTDGCATKKGCIHYCSGSRQLVEDVCFVIRSLGGIASKIKESVRPNREPSYYMFASLPIEIKPFHVQRKMNRLAHRPISKTTAIERIEQIENKEMVCISVEAKDGLYVIDNFTVTHNTTMMMEASLYNARRGEVILNYSAELSDQEYAQIAVSHLLKKDRHQLAKEDYDKAYTLLSGSRYYIGRNNDLNKVMDVLDLLEAAIRRSGAGTVILDTIHFITTNESDTIKAQENAMNRIKSMAQKYGVKWFNLGQPRKATQQFKGKATHVTDAKGSEMLISASDAAFAIHRNCAKVDDPNKPPKEPYEALTQIFLQKGRSLGTGSAYTELIFNGDICTFFPVVREEQPVSKLFNGE